MGYHPQAEDLDYPGKLQRRAAKTASGGTPAAPPSTAA